MSALWAVKNIPSSIVILTKLGYLFSPSRALNDQWLTFDFLHDYPTRQDENYIAISRYDKSRNDHT